MRISDWSSDVCSSDLKHRCAEMKVRIEALRSMVAGAAALVASDVEGETLARECAAARQLAADTYFWCAQEAVQLHGGVGFTWEYDPQLHFKRAQAASHGSDERPDGKECVRTSR